MTTSRVPAAIDALLLLCRAAAALEEVTITDGPPTVNLSNPDQLFIGWQPGDPPTATISQDFASAGARLRDETFAIVGYAEARDGGTDIKVVRDRVFEIVAAVEQVLRATDAAPDAPTLNGAVLWAHLTASDFTQLQSDGCLGGLAFSVTCRARL